MDERLSVRRLWQVVETVHAVVYFTPEPRAAFEGIGVHGFWRGYFGGRLSPLGVSDAPLATAVLYGFGAGMVERAVPAVWSLASPERFEAARRAGAAAALRRLCAAVPTEDVARVANALTGALAGSDVAGRALCAVNAALVRADDPYERLWQAATTWREHRGDGHNAVLVGMGIGPLDAPLLQVGAGRTTRESIQPNRGFSDEEWAEAEASLLDQGLLVLGGGLSADGEALVATVDASTDRVSARWRPPGEVIEIMRRLANEVLSQGGVPFPNPMGLTSEICGARNANSAPMSRSGREE